MNVHMKNRGQNSIINHREREGDWDYAYEIKQHALINTHKVSIELGQFIIGHHTAGIGAGLGGILHVVPAVLDHLGQYIGGDVGQGYDGIGTVIFDNMSYGF